MLLWENTRPYTSPKIKPCFTLKTNKFKGAKLDEMTRGLYGGTSFHTIHLHERRYFNRHV